MRTVTITADDFGLTRGITDSILETADAGAISRVSVLANGFAVEYAIAEFAKRSSTLSIALHVNLTEGKPLSDPKDVPLLVGLGGFFRFSPLGLWFAYTISFPHQRRQFARQVQLELAAQLARVRALLQAHAEEVHVINGHMHVQMVPFIFRSVLDLPGIKEIRLSDEPFHIAGFSTRPFAGAYAAARIIFNFLATRYRRILSARGIRADDHVVGLLFSGRITEKTLESALARIPAAADTSVELITHPGSALPGELDAWAGFTDTGWHFSPARLRERALFTGPVFAALRESFKTGTLGSVPGSNIFWRFVVAGVIATGTNIGLLYVLTDLVGLWYLLSVVIAFTIATAVGFLLQKFWAFFHNADSRIPHEILIFISNNLLGLLFDAAGLYILVEYMGVWYIAAQFFLLAFIAVWNFFVYRFVIFMPKSVSRQTLAGVASYLYTVILKPKPLRSIANAVLLMIIPKSVRTQDGTLILNPRDPVISGALMLGVYEPYQTDIFRKHVKEGDVVLDIGANIGLYTLIAGKAVGEKGKVFSFEPEQENLSFLEKNIQLNDLRNATAVRCAITDRNGEASLFLADANKGNHSVISLEGSSSAQIVQSMRLDDWLLANGIPRVNVIKMDIQGAEPLALKGMERTMDQMPVLFMEYEPSLIRAGGSEPVEVLKNLQSRGYALFDVNEDVKGIFPLGDLVMFTRRLSGAKYANILALPPS
jgi:FkbM family methyltransferase